MTQWPVRSTSGTIWRRQKVTCKRYKWFSVSPLWLVARDNVVLPLRASPVRQSAHWVRARLLAVPPRVELPADQWPLIDWVHEWMLTSNTVYLGNVLLPSAWPPETEAEVLQPLTAVLERRSAGVGWWCTTYSLVFQQFSGQLSARTHLHQFHVHDERVIRKFDS